MKLKVPESGTLRACLDLLAYEHIWHTRLNTTGTRIVYYKTKAGEERKGAIKGLKPGTGDILCTPWPHNKNGLHDCEAECCDIPSILWIETKSSTGTQREKQKEFQKEVEAAGHHYLLVRDVEELKTWLRVHGVIR